MILSSPPLGGVTCISRSRPAGGQITPFVCASLSLSGMGSSPPGLADLGSAPGGQLTARSGWALSGDCAAALAPRAAIIATIRAIKRMRHPLANSPQHPNASIPEVFQSRRDGAPGGDRHRSTLGDLDSALRSPRARVSLPRV